MIPKLLYVAATMAASYLAQRLLAPKTPKSPLDDSKTEPSERGTLLGLMMGHLRVGPVVGFVGNRYTVEEKVEGTGGKGGGGSSTQTVYYETGWHMLSIGLGRSLRRIYSGGKSIWQGDITPATHPSGTSVDLGSQGRFRIYWGEEDQDINTDLAADTGAASRWPHVFYIYWDTKRLGPSAVWPVMEYEITVAPRGTGRVTGDDFFDMGDAGYSGITFQVYRFQRTVARGRPYIAVYWDQVRVATETAMPDLEEGNDLNISTGGTVVFRAEVTEITRTGGYTYIRFNNNMPAAVFPVGTTGWQNSSYTLSSDAFVDLGADPATSLDQIVLGKRPFGGGFPLELFDDSLQDIHDLLETEEMPCTSLLRSGRSWKDGAASIMQDMGLLFTMDPTTGLFGFRALRDGDSVTQIDEEYYDFTRTEETFAYSVLAADSRVFTYKDSARNFAESTIPASDDAQAQYGADPNVKSVALETITSYKPASKAASRRDAELSVDGSITVEVSYLVNPQIGGAYTLEGYDRVLRAVSVQSNPDEAFRTVGFVEDSYFTDADYETLTPQGLNPESRTPVMPDIFVSMIEPNRFMFPDTHGYHILRIRYNALSLSAYVYDSADDTSYSLNDRQTACTGGLLTEALADDTGGFIEEGPEVELLGEDADRILDLSTLDTEWRSGVQMCIINSEIFYLRNITVTGSNPTTFTLNGLIRARMGTNVAAHAVDDMVMIFQPDSLTLFSRPWLVAGQDAFAKTLPYNNTSIVDVDDVESASIEPYQGGGYRPLPCINLNTDDGTAAWAAGSDIDLLWGYRNGAAKSGAGFVLTGEASEAVPPEGTFKLVIATTGDTTVRTVELLADAAYTYTNANLVADFSGEPTGFKATVYNVLNGLTSEALTTTFTRV